MNYDIEINGYIKYFYKKINHEIPIFYSYLIRYYFFKSVSNFPPFVEKGFSEMIDKLMII